MTHTAGTLTDHQLQASVTGELERTPEVDSAHMGVSADDGVVTLTGEVESYRHRSAAVIRRR